MPNDEKTSNPDFEFDREVTGQPAHQDNHESADIDHRIEADTHHDAAAARVAEATAPRSSAEAPVTTSPAQPSTTELPKPPVGLMVLQWLVYAFWGWTVFALAGLTLLVVNNLFSPQADDGYGYFGGGIAYLLAAVMVLYVISLATDLFYARAERRHSRSGGTNVITIIHAVLFALFAIGSLIAAVFGGVNILLGTDSDISGAVASIVAWGIIALLYGATLLRVLRPSWLKQVPFIYWRVITVAAVSMIALGVVGPAAEARLQAQDITAEVGLPQLADEINEYARDNGELPQDLSQLSMTGSLDAEAKQLVDDNAVRYTPGQVIGSTESSVNESQDQQGGTVNPVFTYELCVEYKAATPDSGTIDNDGSFGQRYPVGITNYNHPSGNVCYDVQTDYLNTESSRRA